MINFSSLWTRNNPCIECVKFSIEIIIWGLVYTSLESIVLGNREIVRMIYISSINIELDLLEHQSLPDSCHSKN